MSAYDQFQYRILCTMAKTEIIYPKNVGASVAMNFTQDEYSAPMAIEKSKSWVPFWSYQLNSTANPAHLPQNWAKLAKSAVLFSW